MVVIQLVQRSEITAIAHCERIGIGDIILEASRLFSTERDAAYLVTFVAGTPMHRCSRCLNVLVVACHTDFVEGCDVEYLLWKAVRRHEALMTTL